MSLFGSAPREEPRQTRVSGGAGTMVTQVGDQIAVRAVGRGRTFKGSWKCSLVGDDVSIRQGFVNGMEPFIGKKLLGGFDADKVEYPDGAPVLALKTSEYDADGNSWIGIHLRVDADGKMKVKDYTAEDFAMVQSKRALVLTGLTAFFPVAALRKAKDETGWGTLRQIAWFDYQHGTSGGGEGKPLRHWFYPA